MLELALALEQGALAQALRGSPWLYPAVNAGHILGIALLVGGIIPLDLKLLGCWRRLPVVPFWQVLRLTAGLGLALALTTGSLLFVTRASEYLQSDWFQAKFALILLGLANLVVAGTRFQAPVDGAPVVPGLRRCALFSLVGWPVVLVLGRMVGYF